MKNLQHLTIKCLSILSGHLGDFTCRMLLLLLVQMSVDEIPAVKRLQVGERCACYIYVKPLSTLVRTACL